MVAAGVGGGGAGECPFDGFLAVVGCFGYVDAVGMIMMAVYSILDSHFAGCRQVVDLDFESGCSRCREVVPG